MKFACKYTDLVTTLADVYIVAEDALSNEDMRNIVFQLSPEGKATLIAFNQHIVIKKPIEEGVVTLEIDTEKDTLVDGFYYMSLKSKELREYLNSYKNVRTTEVEEVIFEPGDRNSIKCTTIERVSLSDEEKTLYENNGQPIPTYVSHWSFGNIPIKPTSFQYINLKADTVDITDISSQAIAFHTKNLLPIMQSGVDLYSSVMFDEQNVVVMNAAFTTIMQNNVADGGLFVGVRLMHKCVDFLDKLSVTSITSADEPSSAFLKVAKLERYIYVKSETSEVFLIYDNKLAGYQTMSNMFKKENVITINRIYLKDVLKRLSLVHDNIEFSIKPDDNIVTLRNSKFSQDINIGYQRGMAEFGKVNFKIMPDVLNKSIIGSDEEFTQMSGDYAKDVFIYFCPTQKDIAIVFADATGKWFSVVRVKTY